MFNKAVYNRQSYNRALLSGEDVEIKLRAAERLIGWMNVGATYYVEERYNEQLKGNATGAAGMIVKPVYKEKLGGNLFVIAGVKAGEAFGEELKGSLHAGADIYLVPTDAAEKLAGKAFLSANIYLTLEMVEQLGGLVHLGADVYITKGLYEVLNGYANARDITEKTIEVDGEIPPGSVLVIDSENYNMLLDNVNIIDRHKGDWIDVGRETISLTLSEVGATDFNWEVFYIARYL